MERLEILKLFDDNERGKKESAFSIQNIAVEGLKCGKLPGDWYGVNTITNVLENLNEDFKPIPFFKICVFQDSCVVCERIEHCGKTTDTKEDEDLNQSMLQASFDLS